MISAIFTFMVIVLACDVGIEAVIQADKIWRVRRK